MKKEDFAPLVQLSAEDLQKKLDSARRERVDVKMSVRTGQEKNTAKARVARKNVARIATALNQK